MKKKLLQIVTTFLLAVALLLADCLPFTSQSIALAATDPPNILVIMGDDIGWFNISAYNNGIMGYRTPNIDSLADEGILFTDFYGEQSCTAGRAAFITGQATIRTGMTKVGLPGIPIGLQKEDPTLAELLKPLGYRTGQFGKNHLGDLNEFLPTHHGFDEFFGNLYHLNAEEEPEHPDYPPFGRYPGFDALRPRGVLHTYADLAHRCTDEPWTDDQEIIDTIKGNVTDNREFIDGEPNPNYSYGQRICDTGALTKKRMETIDEEVLAQTKKFISDAVDAGDPFFTWFNTTRMHIYTHLKDSSKGVTGQGIEADGMVEHDGQVGELLQFIKELGENQEVDRNTIIIYSTDNGAETFSWPDGGTTPFRSEKNSNWEGGFRVPAIIRWKNHLPEGVVSNDIMTHLDWVPTLMTAAGVDNIQGQLLDDEDPNKIPASYPEYEEYDVHLDGYNFLPYLASLGTSENVIADPDLRDDCYSTDITTLKDYCPPRHEFIYFTDDGYPSALRFDDWKWLFSEIRAEGFDVWQDPYLNLRLPKLVNLRRDPFEKADYESSNYDNWRVERLFLVGPGQLYINKLLNTFVDYPPRQKPASFGIGQIVDQLVETIEANAENADQGEAVTLPFNSSVLQLKAILDQLRYIGAD